jgi:hypothetical protein
MADVKVLTAEDVVAACPTCVGKPVSPHLICTLKDAGYTVIRELGPVGTKEAPLRKLDLSGNRLTRLTGTHQAHAVTWLNAANNKLGSQSLVDISHMKDLVLLNVSHNNITTVPLSGLKEQRAALKVLLLNNNRVSDSSCFGHLCALNALVLSHNKLSDLHPSITKLAALTKLSLGHNNISSLPDLSSMTQLAELRLNDNKLETLPVSLASCTSIRLVDIGNNKLASPDDLLALKGLRRLVNLNVKGNPVCESFASHDEYVEFMKALCPRMTILDGKRLDTSTHDKSKPILKLRTASAPEQVETTKCTDEMGGLEADSRKEAKRRTATQHGKKGDTSPPPPPKPNGIQQPTLAVAPVMDDVPTAATHVKSKSSRDLKPAPRANERVSGSKRPLRALDTAAIETATIATHRKRTRKSDEVVEPADTANAIELDKRHTEKTSKAAVTRGVTPVLNSKSQAHQDYPAADSLREYDVPTSHGIVTVIRDKGPAATKRDVRSVLASAPPSVSAWD